MHHFNAIMQSRHVQDLSTSDTYGAIRGGTNVTDVVAAQEVSLLLQNTGQFDAPPPQQQERMCQVGEKTESAGLQRFAMLSS